MKRTSQRHAHRGILFGLVAACAASPGYVQAQPEPKRFVDPAPPKVQELAAMDAPTPADYPELRFHRAPAPLDPTAKTSDWPGFLGPDRDSHSSETMLLRDWPDGGPHLLWEMERGQGYASPAIAGDRVVFTHRTGGEVHVDCLHAETGQRFWRFSEPCDYRGAYISNGGPRSTPAISAGRVYVHGVQGSLHCLELATGRVVWQRNLDKDLHTDDDFFGVVASPIICDDLLIQNVGAPGGPCVAAFDKHTGRIVWGRGDRWGPSCSSPVLGLVHGRQRVFVLAGGKSRPPTGGLMVINPKTGAIDFEYPFRSRVFESATGSSPVVGDDWVFVTSSYGAGSAMLRCKADGSHQELWKTRRLGLQFSNAVHHDGHLYAIDGHSDRVGAIVCVDPKTGTELSRTDLAWEESIELRGKQKQQPFSIGEGSLLHADGAFLCLGDNGHLLWLDVTPERTKVVRRAWLFGANESWTPLALSRGLLYVCQNNRERFGDRPPRLLCYDLRRPTR